MDTKELDDKIKAIREKQFATPDSSHTLIAGLIIAETILVAAKEIINELKKARRGITI